MFENNIVHMVLGFGEVGVAICDLFNDHNIEVYAHDNKKELGKYANDSKRKVDVLHICYPYTKTSFFTQTIDYIKNIYPSANLVIIHSTIPVGCTYNLNTVINKDIIVHSPIRGIHPVLRDSIKTFVKYFGGTKSVIAAKLFQEINIKTKCYIKAEITEAMKIWSTAQYGAMIALQKVIYNWCKNNQVPFEDVYTEANTTYNEGYKAMKMSHFQRPILKQVDGSIGGHCIIPNLSMLDYNSVVKFILEVNCINEK